MADFIKSSYCSDTTCVEAAFVSSSACTSGTCVQAAPHDGSVLLRDGKDPEGPVMTLSPEDWTGFLDEIKLGTYNDL